MQDRLPPPVFDSLILAAVAEEIQAGLLRARVTGVVQPDEHSIGLLLRTPTTTRGLLCSIHPRWARCVLVPLPRDAAAHPFALQARARLVGGRLLAVDVPPFDRVLTLTVETLTGPLHLVAEVMGRHSNLLLREGDRITGVFKPVTPAMSRVRPLLPGDPYRRPPRDRPTPEAVSPADLRQWLAEGRPVAQTLTAHMLGISPPVAMHLALRADLDPHRPAPPDAAGVLAAALSDLVRVMAERTFAPTQYADASGDPKAFAAIPLLTYRTLAARPVPSMSAAVAPVVEAEARRAAFDGARHAVLARIADAERRVTRAASEVQERLDEAGGAGRWRRWGELLLAYAATVPAHAAEVTVPGFDGEPVTIPLDPRSTPVRNAQAFFRRYSKATSALRALTERLRALRQERGYLEQVRLLAEQAASEEEAWELSRELAETGLGPRSPVRRQRRPAPPPRTYTTPEGFHVLVGRSNRENDHLTFKVAAPHDLWLHARGMPGAHVILKTEGRVPPPAAVEAAAAIAAHFSRGRGAAKVAVDVTARRHVRKPKGARPGMVTYQMEQTLLVEPRLPDGLVAGGGPGR